MGMAVPLIILAAIAVVLFLAWPRHGRAPASGEAVARANAHMLRDALDRAPWGEAFARRLWARLMACAPGKGHVREFHPYFCGHALIRTPSGVMLADAEDGGMSFGAPIAEWESEAAFVAFFARQSDYSASGWDASEPVFSSDNAWYRGNQRLTRATLEGFMASPAGRSGQSPAA